MLTNSGYVALWHGDLTLAGARFAGAMELAAHLVSPLEAHAGVGLGWAQALRGDLDQALTTVARHQRTSDLPNTLDALTAMVEAHLRRGDRTAAAFCEGLDAALRGETASARERLGDAAALYAEVPCPARQAEALLALSASELAAGRHQEAQAAAASAQALAVDHGMPDLLGEADAALRHAGVRVPGRRRAHADAVGGLSEREREVAVLVAHGLSNAAVGKRLFLSESTARNHVSNILAKLELRSRAEVARWAVQNGLLDA